MLGRNGKVEECVGTLNIPTFSVLVNKLFTRNEPVPAQAFNV